MKKKTLKEKLRTIFVLIVFIICLCLLIYSLNNILKWEKDNEKSSDIINDLQKKVDVIEKDDTENTELINPQSKDKASIYWNYAKMDLLNVDFKELLKDNKDTKGWIKVNGTKVNYPFVQTKDNSYYLTHSFDKSKSDAGWIFLDYRNDINNLSKNNVIYGHARLDKTMFGSLRYALDDEWYNNIDNHVVKISTKKENTLWQIFSVYHIETESYYITTSFKNEKEFIKFIDTAKKRSIYKFNADVSKDDILLTLSTCYKTSQKLVIQAKLIKREVRE